MITNNYVHLECDVKGCEHKVDIPEKEIDSYGWLVGAEYTDDKRRTKKYDLCVEHAMAWHRLRQKQDTDIDSFISTGSIKNLIG